MCMILSHSWNGHAPEPYRAALELFFGDLLEAPCGLSSITDTSSFMRCVRWYDRGSRAAYTAGWRCCFQIKSFLDLSPA